MTYELVNTFLLILLCAGFLLWLSVYLYQRLDKKLLSSPPVTETIPVPEYEIAKKELEIAKKIVHNLPSHERNLQNKALDQEEEKLLSTLFRIQEEQRKYQRLCKERDLAWTEYRDFFRETSFWKRLFSISLENELQLKRDLYIEIDKNVQHEKEHVLRKYRLKQIEKENERNNQMPLQEETTLIEKVRCLESEIFSQDLDTEPAESDEYAKKETEETELISDAIPLPTITENNEEIAESKIFTQCSFHELLPDLSHRVYVDEEFSLSEAKMELIQGANFSHSYFVAIIFKGVHQYQDCNFSYADFSEISLAQADKPHRFLNCDFTEACFQGATLSYTAFYQCRFTKTDWRGAKLKKIKFIDCVFSDCLIEKVDFSETVMSRKMLDEIDLTSCAHPPKNWRLEQNENTKEKD